MPTDGRRVDVNADDTADCTADMVDTLAVNVGDGDALEPCGPPAPLVVVGLQASPMHKSPGSPSDRSRLIRGVWEELGSGISDTIVDVVLIVERVVDIRDEVGDDLIRVPLAVVGDLQAGPVQRFPKRSRDRLISIRGFPLGVWGTAGEKRDMLLETVNGALPVDVTLAGEDGMCEFVTTDEDKPPLETI